MIWCINNVPAFLTQLRKYMLVDHTSFFASVLFPTLTASLTLLKFVSIVILRHTVYPESRNVCSPCSCLFRLPPAMVFSSISHLRFVSGSTTESTCFYDF